LFCVTLSETVVLPASRSRFNIASFLPSLSFLCNFINHTLYHSWHSLPSPNPHRILLNLLDNFHQTLLFGQIKQLAEALRFVKGWFHQFGDVFDVTILNHLVDDLTDEDDLGLVQGLVIDKV